MSKVSSTEYIMWTDGALTSFGKLVSKELDGTIKVKNPAVIMFQTEETPIMDGDGKPMVDEQGNVRYKGTLRWDITPYVFDACIKTGENVWTGRPNYVLEDCEFVNELIEHYNHVIKVTGPATPVL